MSRGTARPTRRQDWEPSDSGRLNRGRPALVIPLRDVWGQPAGFQSRPDEPRVINNRLVKYETRLGQPMVLDCPPRCQPGLGNTVVPLVITEGPIKADSLASAGACSVALLGVWGWRGRNGDDGLTALADWEGVALNGRKVLVAFDSDVMTKPSVHQAMARMSRLLVQRGAEVFYAYLPSGEMGTKVGMDDWLAAGHTCDDLWGLAAPELRPSRCSELTRRASRRTRSRTSPTRPATTCSTTCWH